MPQKVQLPYFDVLLDRLDHGHDALSTAFGAHVHWGYWDDPARADGTPADFARAAERMSEAVCEAAATRSGQAILDIGSGFGGTLRGLNERHDDVSLSGLNIDARQIERAQRLVTARPGNTLEFVEGDACAMPFEAERFDVAIALECAFHFSDRRRFLAEAARVLRPGGRLVVADFTPSSLATPVLGAHQYLFSRYIQHVLGPADASFTKRRYVEAAGPAGLKLREEIDITKNTLPTYAVLRALTVEMGRHEKTARFGVGLLEWLSRMRLLRYVILVFERAR